MWCSEGTVGGRNVLWGVHMCYCLYVEYPGGNHVPVHAGSRSRRHRMRETTVGACQTSRGKAQDRGLRWGHLSRTMEEFRPQPRPVHI